MNPKDPRTNWVIDAVLLTAFLFAFFMNLTGVLLHQWLGVLIVVLIILHFVNHREWVNCMIERFFKKTSGRARLYAVIDLALLFGLILITETGLVISSWFNLELTNFAVWRDVHVVSSIVTLLLAVVKIGLHWRWIVSTAKKIFGTVAPAPQPVPVPVRVKAMDRRQFLFTMGMVSLGSALAISNVLPRKTVATAEFSAETTQPTSLPTAALQTNQTTASQATPAGQDVATDAPTVVPATLPTATLQPVAAQTIGLVCSRGCPKGRHCSFPGQCRLFTDSNANNLCDLGECG